MRLRLSLRARATLLGTVVFAALLVVGSVVLVATLQDRLVAGSDGVSQARVEELLAQARAGRLPARLPTVDDDGAAQVVAADGTVMAASPNLAGQPAVADLRPGPDPETSTFAAPDDDDTETYRFWYAAGPGPDGPVTVYVGDSLESVAEASAALRRGLWLGVPVVTGLLGLAIWVLLGRALGRLDRIRAEVDRISEDRLDTRVAGDGVDDEVGRLAATMNAMLERLAAAAQRQRDLVADVSHDLQSPLAAQRVALELALARPDGADLDRLRTDVLGANADMERLVADLLVVAALDARTTTEPAAIDLDTLVLEEAARARATSRVAVDTRGVSAAPAYANADDVRRVVRNLLGNAAGHAHTAVRLTAGPVDGRDGSDGRVELLVADDGPGIPAAHRARVFDRFYRADATRSPDGGSGLGLPIARGLAERNGGRLDLLETEIGTVLRLLLPGQPQP